MRGGSQGGLAYSPFAPLVEGAATLRTMILVALQLV